MSSDPLGIAPYTPVVGGSADTWGSLIDDAFSLILSPHDHSPGKGAQIRSASLAIDADVAFAGFALTGAKAFTFSEVAASAMTSYADALFANSADHNLYFRNSSGTNVQITAGSQLNLSAVGGIGGDYAAVSALADFTDATHAYGLHQQIGGGVRQYGKLWTGDVSLFEFKANPAASVPSNAVTLKSPTALASGYSLTMPAALPAAQAMIQTSTAGVLTATNTMGSNQPIVMQGTGNVQHGNWLMNVLPLFTDLIKTGTNTASQLTTGGVSLPNNCQYVIRLPAFDTSKKIVSVTLLTSGSTANNTYEVGLFVSGFGFIYSSPSTVTTAANVVITPTTPRQLGLAAAGGVVSQPHLRVTTDAAAGAVSIFIIQILYAADQLGNT